MKTLREKEKLLITSSFSFLLVFFINFHGSNLEYLV